MGLIMAQIYNNITELIGKTPLVRLEEIEKQENLQAKLLVKVEFFNPGGSVKDRIALAMIEKANRMASLSQADSSLSLHLEILVSDLHGWAQ